MPETLESFKRAFPHAWATYEQLRDTCDKDGPLDGKTVELVKIGISAALGHEGGLIAHVSQAKKAGASDEEVYHAILVSTGLAGFSSVLGAFGTANKFLRK